jgi:hypothetical protein
MLVSTNFKEQKVYRVKPCTLLQKDFYPVPRPGKKKQWLSRSRLPKKKCGVCPMIKEKRYHLKF